MKKSVIIILAVAIIGAVAIYSKSHSSSGNSNAGSQSSGQNSSQASGGGSPAVMSANSSYKDGTYTSPAENSPYGNIQIAVIISGGKITDVNFLQMPQDLGRSSQITSYSEPLLKQETIKSQSPNIDFVTGATVTSNSYQQSLQAALNQAAMS